MEWAIGQETPSPMLMPDFTVEIWHRPTASNGPVGRTSLSAWMFSADEMGSSSTHPLTPQGGMSQLVSCVRRFFPCDGSSLESRESGLTSRPAPLKAKQVTCL